MSADLLERLASAGVDQGGDTVAALAGASSSQLKQLKKSANEAGSAVADSMYGAGIRAADGLVKGLESLGVQGTGGRSGGGPADAPKHGRRTPEAGVTGR